MLDKEEVKTSEEVVENIEKEKEEEKVEEVNKEQALENKTDKVNQSLEENKKEKTTEDKASNETKDKIGFLTYFKEGIKNTLGIFVVSVGSLVVLGLILRYIVGFNIKDVWGMLFIVYLVVSLFYPCIKAKFYRKNK